MTSLRTGLAAWRADRATRADRSSAAMLGLGLLMMGLAAFVGLVIAQGSTVITLLVIALIIGPFILLMPASKLLVLFMLMSTVIAGCMQYFARIEQAHWLPALLLMAMLVRLPLDAMRSVGRERSTAGMSAIGVLICLFVVLVFASAAVNLSPPMQVLVGMKSYVFPLALVPLIYYARVPMSFWLKVWQGVPWLMLLQFPLCLYQYVFVEKGSASAFGALGIAWDRVVGSFGGNPEGGGASGALAIFLSFGLVATLALRQRRFISVRLAFFSCASVFASIFLAEVKVMVVFLPLALFIYFRKKVLRSFGSFLAWSLGSVVFVAALLIGYQVLHYGAKNERMKSLEDIFAYTTKAESDVYTFNRQTGEMSRSGALLTWAQENAGHGQLVESLVGYGPAASKWYSSMFGQGAVAGKYRFLLQISTASALLWDVGLLGSAALAAVFVLAFARALRLSQTPDPCMAGLLELAAVALALTGVGLIYDSSSLSVAAVQMLSWWAVGMVVLAGSALRPAAEAGA